MGLYMVQVHCPESSWQFLDVVSGVVSSVADTDGDLSIFDNLREAGENKPEGFPWEQIVERE